MKNKWLPLAIAGVFNVLMLIVCQFIYADSHELISPDGFLAALDVAMTCICMILLFLPYGVIILILTILDAVVDRKSDGAFTRPAILRIVLSGCMLILTLCAKYLFMLSVAALILFPDSFHI